MKAYLIDSQNKTVSEVEYDGTIDCIYRHLDVGTFDVVQLDDNGDSVFVDDEGLLKDPYYFFEVQGVSFPLAGRGLVLGTDDEGDSVEPVMSLDSLKERVSFLSRDELVERLVARNIL